MKGMLAVFGFIALTAFCWGTYGSAVHLGQKDLVTAAGTGYLRSFICVGLSYFVIAVMVPLALLWSRGEDGEWTFGGTLWSLAAGATGALGALGVVMAFKYKGSPLFVMPLVFGVAPVVNTFFTMYLNKNYKEAKAPFFAGLMLVIAGAITVLLFRPHAPPKPGAAVEAIGAGNYVLVAVWTAVTAICWGVYGPLLHKGQHKMGGSRWRPFMCVGLAYLVIAVAIPQFIPEPGEWTFWGTVWSLAGGVFGAVGALGIILAFNVGGKPILVMPLVFGIAPVVNTLIGMIVSGLGLASASPLYYAGMLIVAAGAAGVLIFAPKPTPRPQVAPAAAGAAAGH